MWFVSLTISLYCGRQLMWKWMPKASEQCIDYFITWMENGLQVDFAEVLKRTGALRNVTMNSNIFQCYKQVFA